MSDRQRSSCEVTVPRAQRRCVCELWALHARLEGWVRVRSLLQAPWPGTPTDPTEDAEEGSSDAGKENACSCVSERSWPKQRCPLLPGPFVAGAVLLRHCWSVQLRLELGIYLCAVDGVFVAGVSAGGLWPLQWLQHRGLWNGWWQFIQSTLLLFRQYCNVFSDIPV